MDAVEERPAELVEEVGLSGDDPFVALNLKVRCELEAFMKHHFAGGQFDQAPRAFGNRMGEANGVEGVELKMDGVSGGRRDRGF